MTMALSQDAELGGAEVSSLPSVSTPNSSAKVKLAIATIHMRSEVLGSRAWEGALLRFAMDLRPDLASQFADYLRVQPIHANPLRGLTIGEIGVVYEALLALADRDSRKDLGQYFTPDDASAFMARQYSRFPSNARWVDPCCGIGNLAWHAASASERPADFVKNRLTLIDIDPTALKSAVVLLVASFAEKGDLSALAGLESRARNVDFLSLDRKVSADFAIVNPPYARTQRLDTFETAGSRELFAYFMERVATLYDGFVAVTPASFLNGRKYGALRQILDKMRGGDVHIFDNVPDTLFRGFKYGSSNTSKTNFVRAAITSSAPGDLEWRTTPILRWSSRSRKAMFGGASTFLRTKMLGPSGEWAKIMPGTEQVWDTVHTWRTSLGQWTTREKSEFALHIAATPRYYVSASKRPLTRGSVHTLYFKNQSDLNQAYLVLNSSIPYWWWRCLDGGVTLTATTLLSTPVPHALIDGGQIVTELERSDREDIVTKLNAGKINENVRRPRALIDSIDRRLLQGVSFDFTRVFSPDLFANR